MSASAALASASAAARHAEPPRTPSALDASTGGAAGNATGAPCAAAPGLSAARPDSTGAVNTTCSPPAAETGGAVEVPAAPAACGASGVNAPAATSSPSTTVTTTGPPAGRTAASGGPNARLCVVACTRWRPKRAFAVLFSALSPGSCCLSMLMPCKYRARSCGRSGNGSRARRRNGGSVLLADRCKLEPAIAAPLSRSGALPPDHVHDSRVEGHGSTQSTECVGAACPKLPLSGLWWQGSSSSCVVLPIETPQRERCGSRNVHIDALCYRHYRGASS